jgi:glycosyltransferase involved in cell wall biosynthesis
MKKLIVHVAEIDISEESGMGRVACYWQNELLRRGYEFIHIGSKEVGKTLHHGLFPYYAYKIYQQLNRKASLFLIHEPAALPFVHSNIPTVVFSHGVERRGWELSLEGKLGEQQKMSLKTRLLFPLWRLKQCDEGLKKAELLLLINQEDAAFTHKHYQRQLKDIYVFKNGVYLSKLNENIQPDDYPTILFLGSWILRKGVKTIVEAAKILWQKGIKPKWLLAGLSVDSVQVMSDWESESLPFVEIIPRFSRIEEAKILARSNIFILPSYFEGQPLALLQAMESGRCCITTNCCGQRDIIEHGYNGLLFEPGDSKALAKLIEQCIKDKALRLRLGENAKITVQDRQWEDVSSEVVDRLERNYL